MTTTKPAEDPYSEKVEQELLERFREELPNLHDYDVLTGSSEEVPDEGNAVLRACVLLKDKVASVFR